MPARSISQLLGLLLRAGLALLVMLMLFGGGRLLIWRLEGKQVLSVQTGSMQPVLRPGDAVLVNIRQKQTSPGQVISYATPANPRVLITHRLRTIDSHTGWLQTQGDALPKPDPPFPPRLVFGRAEAVLPYLGRVLDLLHRPIGLVCLIYLPALLIIAFEVRLLAVQLSRPKHRL